MQCISISGAACISAMQACLSAEEVMSICELFWVSGSPSPVYVKMQCDQYLFPSVMQE